ncbi:unnamed protein product [Sphenostylis stenocarpa]|uniref:Sialate O-acetylesterase domain-containing protein n=1 Tax=Sphenostylis stenocarpa TaxID=92480 RepID=A0AA86VSQ5_9FABA|nr:unnamed protein product [Sphenostylis stenocarpa]
MWVMVGVGGGLGEVSRDIFVLAGQSNMAGRGGVVGGKWDGKVPAECGPSPWVWRLSAGLEWEEAREPLHADIDVKKTCGVGPGMAFANEVLRSRGGGNGLVGLVPCAVGGTTIGEWSRGSRLYEELVRRVKHAMRGGMIRGVLWYQGESDTVREKDADGYKDKMERFIMDLRFDLHLPSLLFIQVAVASGEGKLIEKVRHGQMGMTMGNVKCVDAKGLPLKADKLHLTTMAQVHLGIRLAQAYLHSTTHHYQFNTNINHTQF